MSLWTDPERWAKLRSGETCVICRRGAPEDVLVELESSWVTVTEDALMRGYACLVFRRHVVELHDLTEEEGAAFMRDARRLSAAVQQATGAIKLNYEVHGNTIPHLHMHLYPRYAGDPFEGGPITVKAVRSAPYAPGEVEMVRARMKQALSAGD